MTIADWLNQTSTVLADNMIPSARLDAEIILAHTVRKSRTWLHAHSDEELDPRLRDIADARAQLRLDRVPIAYIIRHKEFYGRRFQVSPDVLIPRPESEVLIDLAKSWQAKHPEAKHLVDVGTGSGCLGITAKLEMPDLGVTLCDIDKSALRIAEQNAKYYEVEIKTLRSNLLDAYPLRAHIVIANLPYVDRDWMVSDDTHEEPDIALYAEDGGLALIKELIETADGHTAPSAALILEADPRQHDTIIDFAAQHNYRHQTTDGFGILLERV